jgi:hypothetical protein
MSRSRIVSARARRTSSLAANSLASTDDDGACCATSAFSSRDRLPLASFNRFAAERGPTSVLSRAASDIDSIDPHMEFSFE